MALSAEVIQTWREELEREKKRLGELLKEYEYCGIPDLTEYEPEQRPDAIIRYRKERDDKKEKWDDVEDALARMETGTFGICADGVHEIPKERLESDIPRSLTYKRCCPCQSNHFAKEKEAARMMIIKNCNRRSHAKVKKNKQPIRPATHPKPIEHM